MDPCVLLDDATSGASTLLTGLVRVDAITLASIDEALRRGWGEGLFCFAWLPYDLGEAELGLSRGDVGALYWFRERIEDAARPAGIGPAWLADLAPQCDEAAFTTAAEEILGAIAAGSAYQVNHTHRLAGRLVGDPRSLYATLRDRQPVEFGALAHLPPPAAPWTLSFSPELFLTVDGDTATCRPMKGTAPLEQPATSLTEDPKNRAENLMIVDLMRNDLSRVAVPGTVGVSRLFEVEKVGRLWQMTSTVTATLAPGVTPGEVLSATFPCGSITGAPKLASMRIIRRLETDRRGIYTGCLGVIEPANTPLGWTMVLSVAIRTIEVADDGSARLGIGSGIVADSSPEGEWREGLAKAVFATARPCLQVIETMAVRDGDCALADGHRRRLAQSLAALGFPAAPSAIDEAVAGTGPGAWRVGVKVDRNGLATVTRAPLEQVDPDVTALLADAPWRVGPLSRHKTTFRAHLDAAVSRAVSRGAFDTVGFDARSRVLEGGRSTVFALIDGTWLTPPLRLGVLDGVQRAAVLGDPSLLGADAVEEAEFTVSDLVAAERVVLTNALRGILRARILA